MIAVCTRCFRGYEVATQVETVDPKRCCPACKGVAARTFNEAELALTAAIASAAGFLSASKYWADANADAVARRERDLEELCRELLASLDKRKGGA